MQTPRILWSLAILACAIPTLSAAQAHYQTDLTVSRDGVVIGAPSFGLVPGRQADITSLDSNDPEHGFRVLVTARDASANASATANSVQLDMLFLERDDDEWVLVGEPSIGIEPGKNADVSFSTSPRRRAAHRYEIHVSIEHVAGLSGTAFHSQCGRRRSMLVAGSMGIAAKPACSRTDRGDAPDVLVLDGISGSPPEPDWICCSPNPTMTCCFSAASCCDRLNGGCCAIP